MSIFPAQSLPSGTTDGARFAREYLSLLGSAHNAPDDTLAAADALTWGDAVADANSTLTDASNEFFANLATQTLSAWEFRTGITVRLNAPVADRRLALQAKRSTGGGDIKGRLLRAIQVIEPAASIVTTPATAVAATDPRHVFQFLIVLPMPTLQNLAKMASIDAVVQSAKPAYTGVVYSAGRPFRLDISQMDFTSL